MKTIPLGEAAAMLRVRDGYVHTFCEVPFHKGTILMSVELTRDEVLGMLAAAAEISGADHGPQAQAHGLVIDFCKARLFIETNDREAS